LNDENLIARARHGDLQAYESLVRQYEQVAFRAAFLITHDQHEAADVVQDACLRAYQAIGSFRPDRLFRPWFLRIVTNQALNHVRAVQRRTRVAERYAQQITTEQANHSPEHALAEREQNERLLQAVTKLSADEQALIALRYFLELPENEVAETLQIPLGTVKSRLHRTLTRLREIIQREFPDLIGLTTLDG
jgi:RNA polymerase sigma factor (sigma-70 family)